ncbi:hypothetical protein SALBM311S_11280 [Streptomyces alboniger]
MPAASSRLRVSGRAWAVRCPRRSLWSSRGGVVRRLIGYPRARRPPSRCSPHRAGTSRRWSVVLPAPGTPPGGAGRIDRDDARTPCSAAIDTRRALSLAVGKRESRRRKRVAAVLLALVPARKSRSSMAIAAARCGGCGAGAGSGRADLRVPVLSAPQGEPAAADRVDLHSWTGNGLVHSTPPAAPSPPQPRLRRRCNRRCCPQRPHGVAASEPPTVAVIRQPKLTARSQTVPGRLRRALRRVAAATASSVVSVNGGGHLRTLARTVGTPFRLVPDAHDGLAYQVPDDGKKVQIRRVTKDGPDRLLGSGALGALAVAAPAAGSSSPGRTRGRTSRAPPSPRAGRPWTSRPRPSTPPPAPSP